MEELNAFEQRIKQAFSRKEKISEVADMFKEYFGEDLVSCNIIGYETFAESLRGLTTVGRVLDVFCSKDYENSDTTNVYFTCLGISCCIEETKYQEARPKPVDELPEELYPILDKLAEEYFEDNYGTIIVRFPEVTITNENNKSIKIQELYAKIKVSYNGYLLGRFDLIRSFYPIGQFNSDYCHSHISHISTEWQEPCTGTGPINSTMSRLRQHYNKEVWGLFCYELDKFVRVESIAGVPYRRLENVGIYNDYPVSQFYNVGSPNINESVLPICQLNAFIKEFLEKEDFKIAFRYGSFKLGEPFENFWVRISKYFAHWYNEMYRSGFLTANLDTLIKKGIIQRYKVIDGKMYSIKRPSRSVEASDWEGTVLFIFKGEPVAMHIDTTPVDDANLTYLLSLKIVSLLVNKILTILNYNYGRQNEATEEETSNDRRKKYI